MALISVIVPVYKVEPYLRRCVDSILGQTFADFELILVDDGSPDNCGAICDEYAEKDNRVHVIHQENGGLSAARNAGIDWAFANSGSQWLSFIDSDDWVHPEYLERLLDAAVENNVEVSVCGYVETHGEEPEIRAEEMCAILWETERFFVEHNVNAIIACGKLYRKDCFKTIRYPVGRIHEDEFTTYKILFSCKNIAVISATLYFYFVNEQGITKSAWNPSRMHALDAYVERIAFFRERGNSKLYQWTLSTYIWYIIAMREHVMMQENNYMSSECSFLLTKRLRKEILHYRKDLPVDKFAGAYECAFPRGMQLYWCASAASKKIKWLFCRR